MGRTLAQARRDRFRDRPKCPEPDLYAARVPDRFNLVRPWRIVLPLLAATLTISACGTDTRATTARTETGLLAVSPGLCDVIAAAPDAAAVERAFIDEAHDPLHELAADPRLSRADGALVLQAMQRVEVDFQADAEVSVITADLIILARSADAALAALGLAVPPCER